ncbi:sigma-70 family RNA polymerase sigma factor [Ciceribacter sp. L1K23]|uniref:sigma-70 family RNA polymerase sigma factor n=1 Tax=unclassified Ciceribacter TaxID=2628820 RepID=UPI001ABDA194|nr:MULTISPECIES: sigma-70 family RNA polymerase sigma factor [unclassified Ciceribacter]MBO3761403.1 sigma-70 family RNA polymerase sigma factor [Ciceribacter sp. L1K22]MBR0557050.1 sigma-70 family RNA polymerase sigma factor [Ciceribacter sp. L1K23]
MRGEQVVELIPALRAFARSFHGSPDDADDLVQETLMRAIGSIDQFEEGTRLKSWLFTIMRNTFSTRYRKGQREVVGVSTALEESLVSPAAQEWVAQSQTVRDAILRLPDTHREVLVLIAILGESYEDAAEICGCPVGTVKSRLSRARERLKVDLGEPA